MKLYGTDALSAEYARIQAETKELVEWHPDSARSLLADIQGGRDQAALTCSPYALICKWGSSFGKALEDYVAPDLPKNKKV
ncbi:hypothetical protein TSOC_005584 [Tetrabaena socialis]|uniref:Uncharacterized protein n=1 Tax=Tetrabaena socialis TaxID=47790 RepID=A0A2J8A5W4_9CHLO|nr:hypothetical protein TSOC_005584 [Tetrabaena socialis]|eukprot:PNH07922.1 hypothetical protein TSOC_005584 [Tetrabaena socialis]